MELLRSLGFDLTPHPDVPGTVKHPDFLARRGDVAFYVEATLALPPNDDAAAQARINAMYEGLERLESPNFFLAIRERGQPGTPPPAAQWRRTIAEWLAALDPDEIARLFQEFQEHGFDALPSLDLDHDDYSITVMPVPKSPDLRGTPGIRPVGSVMGEVRVITSHTSLRAAIKSKATRYGNVDLPFLIAVNVIDEYLNLPYEDDIWNGLLGDDRLEIIRRADGSTEHRDNRAPNGVWHGPTGPQNTRCSAVLVAVDLNPEEVATKTPTIYHNPWAVRQLVEVALRLPAYVPVAGRMQKRDGLEVRAILDLPDRWPFWETEVRLPVAGPAGGEE